MNRHSATAATLPALTPDSTAQVCVIMLSALGDVVHIMPVVSALKAHAPRIRITWVLQPGPAQLVRGHPAVDEILLFERHLGLSAFGAFRRAVRGRRFDLVLDFQSYLKAGLLTWLLNAPVKLGFDFARARDLNWLFTTHRIPRHPQQHVQDQLFEFLAAIGVPLPLGEPAWHLGPTAEERAQARALLEAADTGALVGFVVATSKLQKNWPPERFARLADRLQAELGACVVLLGGGSPVERAGADVILRHSTAAPLDLLGGGLRTLLGLLEACDVVVSSDTGPFHMCVAMGVPAVGLYGYTNPKRVGPYRRFGDLVVDGYGDPGEDYPVSTRYRRGRMSRIGVEEVAAKVKLALSRYGSGPPWRRGRLI